MGFRAYASAESASASSLLCNKPTGTANDDIMFAVLKRTSNTDPNSVPSGWTQRAKSAETVGGITFWLYSKLAASEGTDYTFGWADAARTSIVISSWNGEFNTSDPIDVVSNTAYGTNDTTVRAAGVTAAAANSWVLHFANIHASSTQSFSASPSAPAGMTENADFHLDLGRHTAQISSVKWTSSGATGSMDSTASLSTSDKHAFAVVLKPGAGANALEGAATAGALASGALTNTSSVSDLTLRWSM